MDKYIRNELEEIKQRTANKALPKAGMNGFDWTLVQNLFLVNFPFNK
jgi:hypothetical protein